MKTLKNILLINAVSSGATGILLLLFTDYISRVFGSALQISFLATGIFLLLFGGLVFIQSLKNPLRKGWIKFIIALDILWVIESLIILLQRMFDFTTFGYMLIAIVALWVSLMVVLQVNGLKKFSLTKAQSYHS